MDCAALISAASIMANAIDGDSAQCAVMVDHDAGTLTVQVSGLHADTTAYLADYLQRVQDKKPN